MSLAKYKRKICGRCWRVFVFLVLVQLASLTVVIIRTTFGNSSIYSFMDQFQSSNHTVNETTSDQVKTKTSKTVTTKKTLDNDLKNEYETNVVLNISFAEQSSDCLKTFLMLYTDYCNRTMPRTRRHLNKTLARNSSNNLCPCISEKLEGKPGPVSQDGPSFKQLENSHPEVEEGGHWSPSAVCIPRQRIAIIIPFRDRESHLKIFLNRMHSFLQRQMLEYNIFVVEQVERDMLFNKAILMNAGFKEIQSMHPASGQFDCFIFHDVDLLPEDDRNFYTCVGAPRHVGAYVDKWQYTLLYPRIFGGATAFTKRQFELANGFSNEFYGWGGEDDDMLNRVEAVNMTFLRFPSCVATYTMIRHDWDKGNPYKIENNVGFTVRPEVHYQQVGLKTVPYKLQQIKKFRLYTLLVVSVPPPPIPKQHDTTSFTSSSPFFNSSQTTL